MREIRAFRYFWPRVATTLKLPPWARRYRRSHEQLSWFAPRADFLLIFDNSDKREGRLPLLLAHCYPGRPFQHVHSGVNRAVDRAVSAMRQQEPRDPSFGPA
jgi:hypothetical protein